MLIGLDHTNIQGYVSERSISVEYKIDALARVLACYDQTTWDNLQQRTKLLYRRAASTLLSNADEIIEWIKSTK